MKVAINMQIKSDETLSAVQINRIAPVPVVSQNAQKLKDGDFILATVQQNEGDAVLLRTADNLLVRAVLQGEMRFAEGDVMEAVVSRSGGKCFLYILNVLRAGAHTAPDNAENISAGSLQKPCSAAAVPQQMLSDTLGVLKRNPGMDIQTALFLAENSILDTEENMAALAQMSRGEGIGKLLGHILGMMTRDETVPVLTTPEFMTAGGQTDTMNDAASTPTMKTESNLVPESAQKGESAQPTQAPGQSIAAQPVQEPGQSIAAPPMQAPEQSIAAPPTQAPGQSTLAVPQAVGHDPNHAGVVADRQNILGPRSEVQPEMTDEAVRRSTASDATVIADGEKALGTSAEPKAGIRQMIQQLFLSPEGQTGGIMKKMADKIPWELKTLKSQLNQTDIKNKELCLKSVDQAIKQTELSESAMRFEHVQIPLATRNGEYRTAELFVFRRQGGQKHTEGESMSILVALDTQHIGRVEAMVRDAGGGISIEFRLEQPDIADGFKRDSASLIQAIEAAGYRLTGLRFAGLEKRTTVLNAGDMMDAGAAPSGIDVRI